jgi:uncharacterized protein (TIGR00730 family)
LAPFTACLFLLRVHFLMSSLIALKAPQQHVYPKLQQDFRHSDTPQENTPAASLIKAIQKPSKLPITPSPPWVNVGLNVAVYLDFKLLPTLLLPVAQFFNPKATQQTLINHIKCTPYSLSNIFYRLKYPRTLGVQVYGSARPSPNNSLKGLYKLAVKTGKRLVKAGFYPVTGGGPGVMGAVANGAKQANGHTVGVMVPQLSAENKESIPYHLFREFVLAPSFTHRLKGPGGFFHRAGRLLVLPGGIGTLREMLEAFEEIGYSDHISHFPMQKQIVVLNHKGFFTRTFKPMIDQLVAEGLASPKLYRVIRVVNNVDEAMAALKDTSVEWTSGLKNHTERNLKYKNWSLSQIAETWFYRLAHRKKQ